MRQTVLLLAAASPAAAQRCRATIPAPPGESYQVDGRFVRLQDGAENGDGCEACWELAHGSLKPIGGCFAVGTNVDVALPANGVYETKLQIRDASTKEIVEETRTRFVAGPPSDCDARLRGRAGLATNYREWHERDGLPRYGGTKEGGGDATARSEVFIDHAVSPLCYGVNRGVNRDEVLTTISGARGFFGVDYARQEFGHGDRILLDFVLELDGIHGAFKMHFLWVRTDRVVGYRIGAEPTPRGRPRRRGIRHGRRRYQRIPGRRRGAGGRRISRHVRRCRRAFTRRHAGVAAVDAFSQGGPLGRRVLAGCRRCPS